jgi:hypothetical protein
LKKHVLLAALLALPLPVLGAAVVTENPGTTISVYRGPNVMEKINIPPKPADEDCVAAAMRDAITRPPGVYSYGCDKARDRLSIEVTADAPPPPPVDCVVSAWSGWTYTAWVAAGTIETRTGTRSRIVLTPAANGGAACPALSESVPESRPYTPPTVLPAGYFTDLASAPVGAFVTAYGTGFGSSGGVTLGGVVQQVLTYTDTKVVFTVSGSGGELIVGGRNLGQLRVHTGRVFTVTPSTIKTALASWQAGDVYFLRGGTYSGVLKSDNWNFSSNFDIIQSPATADRPIAIVGYPGEVATLNGTGVRPNFIFANSGGGMKASNIVVANLNLIAPNTCVDSGANIDNENRGGENLRVVGNVCTISATGNTMTGMMNFGGNGSTILGNIFVDNPARQIINNNHAVYVHNGADNVTVGYNVFRNLRMGHVVQIHQDGPVRDYMNIRVHDNLLEALNNVDMRGITVSHVSSASTVVIERNTLRNVGQDFSGVSVYGGVVAVRDNKFYGIRAADISLNGMALGPPGSQQRRVTATGNRFETVNGYAAVQAVGGASMSEISLSGNSYCGGLAAQEPNPRPCN